MHQFHRHFGVAALALGALLWGPPLAASVGGTDPALLARYQVNGSANTTGASLMESNGGPVNIALLPESTGDLLNYPSDGTVAAAWLFWSGSTDSFTGADDDIRFAMPNGETFMGLSTNQCESGEAPCDLSRNRCVTTSTPTIPLNFFYCRRDVTGLLRRIPQGQAGGTYTVGDVQADFGRTQMGNQEACAFSDPFCQAKFAGWSLVVIWQSASATVVRDAALYDGFLFADEDFTSPGGSSGISQSFTISGFQARAGARAELSLFALEGDAQLGVPPQDNAALSTFCPTCFDFLEVSTPSRPMFTKVGSGMTGLNPINNLFNSSNKGGGSSVGVDVDSFNIGQGSTQQIVNSGDTSMTFRVGSGDGAVGGDAGGGELFFLGYVFLALDTDAPRLSNSGTFKSPSILMGSPGDLIAYTIRVNNDGAADATNVTINDTLPPSTTYVANSTTTTCGVPVGDVGGTSILFRPAGLNIGTLNPIAPRKFCEVRFSVRINANAPAGDIRNVATVRADQVMPFNVEGVTTVIMPTLARFQKTVAGATGGGAEPGDTLTYTLTMSGNTMSTVNNVSLTDTLPPGLIGIAVTSRPMGSTLVSDAPSGQIRIDGISVPQNGTAVVTFTARVSPGATDGTVLANQAQAAFMGVAQPMSSDDPATMAFPDPTNVTVRNRVDLSTSSKIVLSPGGSVVTPAQVIQWRIRAINSGNRSVSVAIGDDLPPNVGSCAIISAPMGVTCQPGGANGTGRVVGNVTLAAGGTANVDFSATVLASAPDGASITNRAILTPSAGNTVVLDSPTLTVQNRPVLTTSTKIVNDLNGAPTRPGEAVRYTVTVTNSGNRPATNVVVTDTVDMRITITSVGNGGARMGNTITWNSGTTMTLASVAAGTSVALTFDGTVATGLANGTVIPNTASISSTEVTPAFVTPAANLTITAAPIITATNVVTDLNGAPFRPNDVVRYTITLTNTGDARASAVFVTAPLDANLTFVSASTGGSFSGGRVIWDVGNISVGATRTVTVDARINTPLDNGTTVSNQGSVTTPELMTAVLTDDPAVGGTTDPTRFTVTSSPILTLSKAFTDIDGGDTLPGDQVRYTLVVTNTGDAVSHTTTITDTLDARLTQIAAQNGGTVMGQTVTWALGNVLPGTPSTVTFTARVATPLPNGTVISNQSRVTESLGSSTLSDDPAVAGASDPTRFTVRSVPRLVVTKRVTNATVPGPTYQPNHTVAYDITVTNSGTENALNVVITDVIDANLTTISPGPSGRVSGNTVTYDRVSAMQLASVAPSAAVTFRTTAVIRRPLANGTLISNRASATADTLTPVLSDDPDTATLNDPTTITVTSNPTLVVAKTVVDVNGGSVRPGDQVQYTVRVTNTGNANATNVVIQDPVDARLTNPAPSSGGSVGGGGIRWDSTGVPALANLVVDTFAEVSFTATVASPLDDGVTIDNRARITADNASLVLSDDPNTPAVDATTIRVTSAADLSASTKEILNAAGMRITEARPGDPVRYRITVRNVGTAIARDVVVDDVIPTQFAFGSADNGGILTGGTTVFWNATAAGALAAVAPGDAIVLTFTGSFRSPIDDGVVIGNQGRLRANAGMATPFLTDDPATAAGGDQTRVTIRSAPVIAAVKTFSDATGGDVEPGDTVTWTVHVINTGTANARNVVITDNVDLTNQQITMINNGGTSTGSTVTWSPANPVSPGMAPTTFTFTTRILPTTVSGTIVGNQASVTAQGVSPVVTDDPGTPAPLDPTRFTVRSVPRLVVRKALPTGASRIVAPLDTVTYELSVTNTGSAVATQATLRDELPMGLTFVSATGGGMFDPVTRIVRWTLADIAPFGGEARLTLVGSVDDLVANDTRLDNQAFGNAQGAMETRSDDPGTPTADDPTTVTVRATVDLTGFTKSATDENGGLLVPGDVVIYRLALRNTGTTASRSVSITDQLPAELEVIDASNNAQVTGNLISWTESAIPVFQRFRPSDGAVNLTIRARVRLGVGDNVQVSNQATVRSLEIPNGEPSNDPNTPVDNDPAVLTVRAPVVTFTKTITDENGGALVPGDTIRYVLTMENTGGAPALLVHVDDNLPPELENIELQQGGVLTGQAAHWDATTTSSLGSLAAGARFELVVRARIHPNTPGNAMISNRGTLQATGLAAPLLSDDPSTTGPDSTDRRLQGMPDFAVSSSIVIDGNPATVRPGDPIRFTITVRNSGTARATGVSVTANLDPLVDNLVVEDGGNLTGTLATWDATGTPALLTMMPLQSAVVHVRGTVRSPAPDGAVISQRARVRSNELGQSVEVGPVTVVITSKPRLAATTLEVTDVNSGEVEPGDVLTYRLSVHNDGSAVARNVRASLPVPAGTRYLQSSTRLRGVELPDVGGLPAFSTETTLGDIDPGSAVTATFQVRVLTDVNRNARISAQALVASEELGVTTSDDPRTTEIVGDPTVLVVGGGPVLAVMLVADPSVTGSDGTTELRLLVENAGSLPAHDVLVRVPEPSGAVVLAGSLRLDGVSITDVPDGDAGGLEDSGWWLRFPLVESGETRKATARIRLDPATTATSWQAHVTRPGSGEQLSDSDPTQPGEQLTLVSRPGARADLTTSSIDFADVNGGIVEPGDELAWIIRLNNRGATAATLRMTDGFLDALDPALSVVANRLEPSAQFQVTGTPQQVKLQDNAQVVIAAGETLSVRFRTKIAGDVGRGRVISNSAVAIVDTGAETNIGPARLTVGSVPGTALVRGSVYEDRGGRNSRFDAARDVKLTGYQVMLVPLDAGPRATPVMTALTDSEGRYELRSVGPGDYRVRVASAGGAQFADHQLRGLKSDEQRMADLRIDPSGIVYDSRDGKPLSGVTVTLFYDNRDASPANDVPVPEAELPAGQQRQVTGADGRYRFDPFPGAYSIRLDGPSPTSVWPSAHIPPTNDDNNENPLGSFARTDSNGFVVEGEEPDTGGDQRYYLRFDLVSPELPVLHNHIPVDPLQSLVRVQKLANKSTASIGDIITYTVRVTNGSPQDMTVADMGGVEVSDAMPAGFKLLPGSMRVDRIQRDVRGAIRRERLRTPEPTGKRLLTFGPFDLIGRTETEVRYQVVVGPSVRFGKQVNRAVLLASAGQVKVSNEAEASVDIRPEAVFDDGTVIGKVFCDSDDDGWQDPTEEGAVGVRVVLDNGFYAETDEAGRFHFTIVHPGSHLAKLDENTLPPGSRPTTMIRQNFYVTRGLPTRISYGVTCPVEHISDVSVTLNTESYKPFGPPPAPPIKDVRDQVTVQGVANQRAVKLGGVRQEAIKADLGVAFGTMDPVVGQADGPNLFAFDPVKGLLMPLTFHPRGMTTLPLAGWRLVVEDAQTHDVVMVFEQEEPPPAILPWDGRENGELKLAAGHTYIATLAVVATNGDVGISAPRNFGIAIGTAPEGAGAELILDETGGALFESKKPARRVLAWMKDEGPKLGNRDSQISIEVHGDDKTTEAEAKVNQGYADELKKELVTLGFAEANIQTRGLNGEQPRVPNVGRAQRMQNRRIVLRSRNPASLGAPVPAVPTTARVLVNGQDVSVGDGTRFEASAPARVGDIMVVDVTAPTGQRSVINRLYTGGPFPEGAPPPPGSAALQVQGDIAEAAINIDGEMVPVTPSSAVTIKPAGESGGMFSIDENGVPDREIAFNVYAPAETLRWGLRIFSDPPKDVPAAPAVDGGMPAPAGTLPLFPSGEVLVHEATGEGSPPTTLTWSGQNVSGTSVLRAGTLHYRFSVDLPGGVQSIPPDGTLTIMPKSAPTVVTGAFGGPNKTLSNSAKTAIAGVVTQWKRVGGVIEVSAHTDDQGPRMKALFETQQQAEQVKEALVAAGVPETQIVATGRGSQQPRVPNLNARQRAENRRVELVLLPPAQEVMTQPPAFPPAVEINGIPVELAGSAYNSQSFLTRQGTITVVWRNMAGDRTVLKHKPRLGVAGGGAPQTLASVLGPKPVNTMSTVSAQPPAADGGSAFVLWEAPPSVGGGTFTPGGFQVAVPPAPDGGVLPPPIVYAPDLPWRPLDTPILPDPLTVPAHDLVVDLPPEGKMGTDRLMVRGFTHPANAVTVNGAPAVVDTRTGRFIHVLKLSEGDNVIRVETTDGRGNKGAITRRYTVDTTGLFILAFADTAAGGAGARLDELGPYNSISPVILPSGLAWRGGPVTLYGRGAVYLKGKWRGFWRIPFIEATLHIDTNRFNEQLQERDLVGQLTYYPTFGDNGLEVHDARARYPVYLKVKAGENEAYVGNTTAQLTGGDLFKYSRARYAAVGTVDQGYFKLDPLGGVDVGHTRARLFVAGGDTPRRPAHVELRGTGGSLYFMKDRDIIEGSERVYVVVRDAITGSELMRVQKVRNQDYVFRYREGRITLNEPLSAFADGAGITNTNPTQVLGGNPVFLVIDYEHEGQGDFSEFGFGGAVEQTVLDHFAVGGGYVMEARRNKSPSYQLIGAHARAFWDQDNFVQAEWAYSRSIQGENALSNDGGLTWTSMGQNVDSNAVIQDNRLYPSERQGHAFKVKGQVALGKHLLKKNPNDLAARAYFQRIQSGFFADGSLIDQGQYKYGAEGFWQVTRKDSMRIRWDGVVSDVPQIPQVSLYRALHREIATAQLRHREGPFTLTAEYAVNYTEDAKKFGRTPWSEFRRNLMNVAALQIDLQAHKNFILYGRQEAWLTADERLAPRWNDRLTSTVGAKIKLLENLELNVAETLRWNGENATQIGLKTKIDDKTEIYAAERFQYRTGTWVNTSILGASQDVNKDSRTYAEYQLDTGPMGNQSRGVMGVNHQWTLLEGFTIGLGYERVQVLGNSTGATGGLPTTNQNGTPVPPAFSDSYTYAAPGAVAQPSPYLGSGSRDAMVMQVGFNRFKWLKIQSRFEVRYDNADQRRGGYDRLVFFTANDLKWNWTDDLAFVGRFHLAEVQNQTLRVQEASLQELSAGLAYRPVHHDWFSMVGMVRHRLELRPIMLTEGRFDRTIADVASIEPIVELPFGFQIVEKLALKLSREKTDDLKEGNAFTALWINRLNFHAFRMLKKFVPMLNRFGGTDIDLAVEYRLRTIITQHQWDHGFVTEVGVVPVPYVRIGVGFNFSRISDDEFAKANQNAFGPYMRLQAQY